MNFNNDMLLRLYDYGFISDKLICNIINSCPAKQMNGQFYHSLQLNYLFWLIEFLFF